jgi:hypothetical protein
MLQAQYGWSRACCRGGIASAHESRFDVSQLSAAPEVTIITHKACCTVTGYSCSYASSADVQCLRHVV